MFLWLNDTRTLKELQDEFQSSYPYLQILFFREDAEIKKILSVPKEEEPFLKAIDLFASSLSEMIEIEDLSSIQKIKEEIRMKVGLHVSFLHFTEAGWVQTGSVQEATFGELNEQGRRSFHSLHHVSASPGRLLS